MNVVWVNASLRCDGRYICSPELYAPISDICASSFFSLLCWLVVYLRLQNKFMSYFRLLFFCCFSYFSFESTKIHEMIPSENFYVEFKLVQLLFGIRTLFVPLVWFVWTFPFFFHQNKGKRKRKTNFIITKRKVGQKKVVRRLQQCMGSNDDVDAPK